MSTQRPSFCSTAFTAPIVLRNSAFAPHVALRPDSTCLLDTSAKSSRIHPHAPTMILGMRRIFAPSTRPTPEQTVEIVEPAPTPPSPVDKTLTWGRAHPFQAAAAVTVLYMALRQAFQLIRKSRTTTKTNSMSKSSSTSSFTSSSSSSSLSTASPLRAIPKRHETTEEALDLLGNTTRKYVIVGGKGGVGKTSMSAAVATAFADRGQTTLIVSTDPAHSLSDAFGQIVSGGDPVPVSAVDNLYAQEVDPDSMKRTFKMMNNMGGGKSLGMGMDDMGLDELNSLFDTIPPGFDEAVALVEIIKYIEADAEYTRFDRIVFDTAPTGHTLRLLALPDFLNGFFGKIISMKSKFGNVMNQFKGMFGNDVDMDNSMEEMEELKRSMNMVRELFRDEVQTEFVVATIPNMMAIAESQRLVDELRKEQIPVRHLFVNQVQPQNDDCTFCSARHREHTSNMKYIEQQLTGLKISTVQCFDKEIKGAPALRTMGSQLFPVPESGEAKVLSSAESVTDADPVVEPKTPMPKAELVE